MRKIKYVEVRKITDIKQMLEQSVELFADETAFKVKKDKKSPYECITYKQYGEDVNALGTELINMGLGTGSRIAVIGANCYNWGVTYFAVLGGEAMIVPIDKELNADDIINLLNVSKSDAVVYSSAVKAKLGTCEEIKAKLPNIKYLINLDSDADEGEELSLNAMKQRGKMLADAGDTRFKDVVINREEAKVLLFTSGTTAMSKGVLLSHRNLAENLMSACSMVNCDTNDVFLSVLPIHHTYECTCGFLAPIFRGSAVAYCDGLRYIPKNLKESGATIMLGVPAIFEAIYKRVISQAKKNNMLGKLKKGAAISNALCKIGIDKRRKIFATIIDNLGGTIRLFVSGAAAINPEIEKAFRTWGIDFIQGYGITECSPIIAMSRVDANKPNSAGLPARDIQVRIADPNDEGVGEIVVKGQNVMMGYYENPQETAAAIINGWFHTGDLGYIDDEGFIFITGRKKNVIVTQNGKNIYPEELEAFINENEYVKESMVYGDGDPEGEMVISATIVPDYAAIESILGEDVSDEKVKELMQAAVDEVNKRNPLYKYIRNVTVQKQEFEKTTTQKIKRYLATKK